MKEKLSIPQIKERYFNQDDKQITLDKETVLLEEDRHNERLYLILEGELRGYLKNEEGERVELFRSGAGMFVGVYSFFSDHHTSYATVVAHTRCRLAILDMEDAIDFGLTPDELFEKLFPVLVNELSTRQKLSHRVALEKEVALKKLLHAEKMATLGQMASGLAHELNNAVGVMKGKSEWLSQVVQDMIEQGFAGYLPVFQKGLEKGNFLSTQEVREKAHALEKQHKLSSKEAKKLARTGMTVQEIEQVLPKKKASAQVLEQVNLFWEIGASFHDLGLAARHATHVVKSVKQLGATHHQRMPIDLNETIHESLALLKSLLKNIQVELALQALPAIPANSGELVQVWINLIKNACESLIASRTADPLVAVRSKEGQGHIIVEIEDNGPGVSQELKAKIFQPNVTTKVDGLSFGLGLGLSIVERIVDSYGGTIHLSSKPGKTLFRVQLPIS